MKNIFFALLGLLFLPTVALADARRVEHVVVETVSDYAVVQPGQQFNVGVKFAMDPGWHIYWSNPGDSGMATEVNWQSNSNLDFSDILYPLPHKVNIPPIVDYGYKSEAVFSSVVKVSPQVLMGNSLIITAQTSFLMCKDICLPGSVTVNHDVRVAEASVPSAFFDDFKYIARTLPQVNVAYSVTVFEDEYNYYLHFPEISEDEYIGFEFFPSKEGLIDDSAEQSLVKMSDGLLALSIKKDEYSENKITELSGLIVSGENGYNISSVIQPVKNSMGKHIAVTNSSTKTHLSDVSVDSLIIAIVFALFAGLILNLMPCVLPVLSLKVMGLIHHSKKDRTWRYGVVYTAGVLVTFFALAAVLVSLKSMGEQIGWGFHLQSPGFIAMLVALLTLISLNLFGVFHLGTSLGRLHNFIGNEEGLFSTFMTGVLITIVATPCTVPFMGGAVAYSLAQSNWMTPVIFGALGFGLSLPYLLLTSFPKLLKFLPKPGAWELKLQQFFAFPMLATALWLAWVYARQTSLNHFVFILMGVLCLSFGAWVLGQYVQLQSKFRTKCIAWIIFTLTVFGFSQSVLLPDRMESSSHKISWKTWSTQSVEEGLMAGRPVFVNFTADWCITCKVNESAVLKSDELLEIFESYGVLPLVGDWTQKNEDITRELAKHGRSGVPLYVMYLPAQESVTLMPQLLSVRAFEEVLSPLKL